MSPASRTPRSARRSAAWPTACASVLEDLARHGTPVRGQRREERDQLDRDARGGLGRHRLRPLAGRTGRRGRRRRSRSAARRRTGGARAGGPSGDGWRSRRRPDGRAGRGRRRAGPARRRGSRDPPGSARPPRAPRRRCSRPSRSAGPRRRRPPRSASPHCVRCLRRPRRSDRGIHRWSRSPGAGPAAPGPRLHPVEVWAATPAGDWLAYRPPASGGALSVTMGRNLMRISTILVTTAAAGAALVLSAGPATAGEINGNGQPSGGEGWERPTPTPSARSPAWRTATEGPSPGPAAHRRRTGGTARSSSARPRLSARRRASSRATPATATPASWSTRRPRSPDPPAPVTCQRPSDPRLRRALSVPQGAPRLPLPVSG